MQVNIFLDQKTYFSVDEKLRPRTAEDLHQFLKTFTKIALKHSLQQLLDDKLPPEIHDKVEGILPPQRK